MSWINKITNNYLNILKKNNNYRVFNQIQNINQPYSLHKYQKIINWSNNDYNDIIHNSNVKLAMIDSIHKNGCGSGGTRNISGNNNLHQILENKIATFHNKESGLLFNSGYLANYTAIKSFGDLFPNAEIFSDKDNHASIINGISASKLKKNIFEHNNMNQLEEQLSKSNSPHKIIVIEAIYSMDGSITPFYELKQIAKKYDCLTYIDEIHSVGVYGKTGAGLTEYFNTQDETDIIMGGFGKGFGVVGGYITGNHSLIDSIRSCGTGFIFTTSIPPHLTKGICKSIDIVKKNITHNQIHRNSLIQYFQNSCQNLNISLIKNNFTESHLQFIMINDSKKCLQISNKLLNKYGHYVQSINYPTVPEGKERLRISIKPFHSKEMIDDFLDKFKKINSELPLHI